MAKLDTIAVTVRLDKDYRLVVRIQHREIALCANNSPTSQYVNNWIPTRGWFNDRYHTQALPLLAERAAALWVEHFKTQEPEPELDPGQALGSDEDIQIELRSLAQVDKTLREKLAQEPSNGEWHTQMQLNKLRLLGLNHELRLREFLRQTESKHG